MDYLCYFLSYEIIMVHNVEKCDKIQFSPILRFAKNDLSRGSMARIFSNEAHLKAYDVYNDLDLRTSQEIFSTLSSSSRVGWFDKFLPFDIDLSLSNDLWQNQSSDP